MRTRIKLYTILSVAALAVTSAFAPRWALQDAPTGTARTTLELTTLLERRHYVSQKLDDALSARVLDRYLEILDPGRALFLAQDVAGFEVYRTELDDALRAGELEPAFLIFRRFAERLGEHLDYLERSLASDLETLTFDGGEFIELDRRELPWPADRAELEGLWRRRFENDVLSLKLAGRDTDGIRTVLERRYANQRRFAERTNDDDVFRMFANALASSYDPHTRFLDTKRAEDFDIEMSLSVQGIGALLGNTGEYVRIERLIPGGPAEGSGELTAEDRIVAVGQGADGELVDVIGWRTDEVADLVRGEAGTTVRLSILPALQPEGSPPREVNLVRESVALEEEAARSAVIPVGEGESVLEIGVIELPTFYMDMAAYSRGDADFRSTTRDVARLVRELMEAQVDGIVLDLRNNGGGSLVEVNELGGLFVGARPVVQVRSAGGKVDVLTPETKPLYDGPLLVLVNRLSASASEIFSGAVQDYGRGLVVGERTFGKGTVQSVIPITDGELILTQAKFYRVTGASTQLRGVEPDLGFPAVYDATEIGEEAFEDALPWDEIRSLKIPADARANVLRALPELAARHEARAADDPRFVHLRRRLAYRERQHGETRLSLDIEVRRAEQSALEAELLEIENDYRAARGLEPVESLEDLPRDTGEDEVDPLQQEAARILVDFIELVRS